MNTLTKEDIVWLHKCINIYAHLGSTIVEDWYDAILEMVDVLEAMGIAKTTYCSNNPPHGLQLQ